MFADTPSMAKAQISSTEIWYEGDWTDIRVRRAKEFDGMESLSAAELALKQWRRGWQWFDLDEPDVDQATDQEFLDWYKRTFKEANDA